MALSYVSLALMAVPAVMAALRYALADILLADRPDTRVTAGLRESGDRIEKISDPTRDATLTVHYFDSEDGVCRTAFASVSNQIHECREHSMENAWKFISQFKKEN